MSFDKMANCPRCGKIFVRSHRTVCPQCYQEEEAQFDRVYRFIRQKKYRTATIDEVSHATDVPIDTITRFIREGRLRIGHLPNMGYPCESCGAKIREGRVCSSCAEEFHASVSELGAAVQKKKEERRKKKEMGYTFGDDFFGRH